MRFWLRGVRQHSSGEACFFLCQVQLRGASTVHTFTIPVSRRSRLVGGDFFCLRNRKVSGSSGAGLGLGPSFSKAPRSASPREADADTVTESWEAAATKRQRDRPRHASEELFEGSGPAGKPHHVCGASTCICTFIFAYPDPCVCMRTYTHMIICIGTGLTSILFFSCVRPC